MRALAAFLAVLLALGPAGTAHGQDTAPETAPAPSVVAPSPPDVPPGDDVILVWPLTSGDHPPSRGMLLDTDTAIRWTFRLRWYQHELQLTLDTHAREMAAVQASHDRLMLDTRESYQREIDGLREDLRQQASTFAAAQAQASQRPFYDTFGFGLTLGLVIAGVLVGLAAWALSSI